MSLDAPPTVRDLAARLSDRDLDRALDAALRGDLQPAERALDEARRRGAPARRPSCIRCGAKLAPKGRRCPSCKVWVSKWGSIL